MSLTRNFGQRRSSRFSSTVNFAINLLITTALAVFVCCLLTSPSHAQGSLSLGTMTLTGVSSVCPTSNGWYYYSNGSSNTYMNCQLASIGCPNTASLSLTSLT
jgi:hypothetical protein